jgi:hypothetical protein
MQTSFYITIDQSQVASVEMMLAGIRNGAEKAIMRGVNQGLSTAKTQGAKNIGNIITLKASRIKEDMTVLKASIGNLSGRLKVKSLPPGLMKFAGVKQAAKGVNVKKWKAGKPELISGGFIAPGENANTHVFVRKYRAQKKTAKPIDPKMKYGKLPDKYRLKILTEYGPRVATILERDEVMKPTLEVASEKAQATMLTQAEKILQGY